MSRSGRLKAINPNKTPTEIPYTRLFNDATISDTVTPAIEKLAIKSNEKDLGVSSGKADGNTYLILANPLLFGLSTAQMKSISDKLFPAYKWQAYTPCKASYKSLPYLEVGDWVKVTTFKGIVATFPIFSRELSDINLIADTVETKGKKEQKKTVSSAKQIQVLSWNVHEMENTLETFKSKIENITTEVGNANKGTKQYYLQTASANKPSKTDNAWTETQPASIGGQHMWYMLADVTTNGNEVRHEPIELTGIKGETGRGIIGTPEITYQAGSSATTPPTGEWLANIPLVNEGYTLWVRAVYKYSDDTTSEVFSPSIAGKTGRGVKHAEPQYYLSISKTELVGGEWSNRQPEKTKDTWIWIRYKTIFTDDSIGYSEAVKADALNGWIDVSIANKSTIEQLNNSVNLSVQETTAIKKSLQSTNDDLHALEAQTQQYATKAELQLTKDSISQTLTEEIDGKTAVLKQIKLQSDGMHIQGKEGSTTEQVLDEKSSKIVVNGKVMVDVNSTETRVQSLKAEGNFATGAHKFKRGMMKEISGETVVCTNIYWIGGE